MSNGRGARVHSAQLWNHQVMLLLVLLLASSATVSAPAAQAATWNQACIDETWKNYNICLVQSGSWVCDLKFMMSMALCYVTPVF